MLLGAALSLATTASAGASPCSSLTTACAPRSSSAPVVRGVVVDSAGQPIGDVRVFVNALNRTAITNDSGRFVFTGLPAGTFHVIAMQIGYRPSHADIVVPAVGADLMLRIVMARATTVTQLGAVQVTATPIGTDPRDVAQSTTEISAAALARHLSGTVAQTLASEPGISVRYNGPAASAPVIRGLSGERILVLQDGERAGDLSATSPDHAVSIDPLTAQRIEIVRGPASLLYGNNALGGVVNVISNDLPTAIPEHVDGYVNLSSESGTPGGAGAAGVTIPLTASLALVGRGQVRRANDLRMGGGLTLQNSYFDNASGVAGLGYAGGKGTAGALYRGYQFEYGLPSADNDGAHIEGQRHELSGRAEFSSPPRLFTTLRVNGSAQWYGHDEIEPNGVIGTRFNLHTQSFDVLGRTKVGRVSGAVGAQGTFRQYSAAGDEALTPAANSNGGGLFVYQEIPLGTATEAHDRVASLQVGARYDLYSIETKTGDAKFGTGRSRDFNNVSGSVGVSIPFSDGVSLGVSAARAFRAPTVEELFSNAFHAAVGTYDVGNPNLKSETNQGLDAILRVQNATFTAQLSGYYNRVDNFVAPNIVADTTIDGEDGPETVPLNRFRQADATLKGVEGRAEVEVMPHVVIGAMGDVVRGSFASGEPLSYIPPARIGALARFDNSIISLDLDVRHAFSQGRVPVAVVASDPASVVAESYDLVNLSASYAFSLGGRLSTVTLRADNVFDEKYRDASSRIKDFAFNPGRNVALVYRLLF